MSKQSQEKRKVTKYDEEFKRRAVILYRTSTKSYAEVSNELGIPEGTLAGWSVNPKYQSEDGLPPQDAKLLKEIKELRRQLADVEEERAILKKAIAIFSAKSTKG